MSVLLDRNNLRETLSQPSAQILIAVNLSIIAGVYIWQWSVFDIVFLYWVENLVIGVINVLRMAIASGDERSVRNIAGRAINASINPTHRSTAGPAILRHGIKFFLIPFFIVHYGGFCYGHGMFVMAMFGADGMMDAGNASADALSMAALFTTPVIAGISLLTISHLFSFVQNFLMGGEYKRTNAATLMMRPYGRIVALHITILLGAFLAAVFGSPLALLVVLVIMKTGADLALHRAERRKLAG